MKAITLAKARTPVYVITSSKLAGQANDTEVPICLAYDMVHYEPLVPDTEHDVQKTIQLKQAVIQGNYEKDKIDISFLNSTRGSTSYASALKKNMDKGDFEKSKELKLCTKKGERKGSANSTFMRNSSNFKKPQKAPIERHVNNVVHSKKQKVYHDQKDTHHNSQPRKEETLSSNRFHLLSDTYMEELEELKRIKKKDKTAEQLSRYADLMKLQNKEKTRLRVASFRAKQSPEQKNLEREKRKMTWLPREGIRHLKKKI